MLPYGAVPLLTGGSLPSRDLRDPTRKGSDLPLRSGAMFASLLAGLNRLLYRNDDGPAGAGPGLVIFRSGAAALVILLGACLGLIFLFAGAVGGQILSGLGVGVASFAIMAVAGLALGRRRTAIDGTRMWLHNSFTWRQPIELDRVLAVHYQFIPRQGAALFLATDHVGSKVLVVPSWLKGVPAPPSGFRRVGINLRAMNSTALLAALSPTLLAGNAAIDDRTRAHLQAASQHAAG
jgi:hypothetical protein